MSKMSSKYATFHAAQDLFYALQNPVTERPLVKLGYGNKEALNTLAEVFIKSSPPAVPQRVPVSEGVQEKLKEANQERSQMKIAPQ